jgi:uncharacterized protein (TIGR02001 family)
LNYRALPLALGGLIACVLVTPCRAADADLTVPASALLVAPLAVPESSLLVPDPTAPSAPPPAAKDDLDLAAGYTLPLAPVGTAAAEAAPLTGNVTLTSEYAYRGIAQTDHKPALQGCIEYAFANGFYVGNWDSNITWLSDANARVHAPVELDFYGGYRHNLVEGLDYDVGYLEYYYPGGYPVGMNRPDTGEAYGALTFGPATLKYSYAITNLFGFTSPAGDSTRGSGYLDLSIATEVAAGLTAGAHVGHQSVAQFGGASYTDYRISLAKDFSGWLVTAAAITTNARGGPGEPYLGPSGKNLGAARLIASVGRNF